MSSPDHEAVLEPVEMSKVIGRTEFATELLLAEYKGLRDEIIKKMDHRTSMVVCSVTVSSAVLGFGIERQSAPLLLVSPLVSLLLGLLILFQNMQIGLASEHLRKNLEQPLSKHVTGFTGWHEAMANPRVRVVQRLIPYHLSLVLIAVAPATVAIPLALARFGPAGTTVPVLIVVILLLALYIVQLFKDRHSI
ncbi:hypothetical protein [Saccharothrix sp.]|uniref:hypothetical protein n=1 Tax=Saccharothrix sp. TaxID=1873460 RepID=UPI0028114889|nr:hypothetical protein [Saccharothrix sp.]